MHISLAALTIVMAIMSTPTFASTSHQNGAFRNGAFPICNLNALKALRTCYASDSYTAGAIVRCNKDFGNRAAVCEGVLRRESVKEEKRKEDEKKEG
jgi:hypothetical protein